MDRRLPLRKPTGRGERARALQRNIPVLLLRVAVPLGAQHPEPVNEPRTRVPQANDIICVDRSW